MTRLVRPAPVFSTLALVLAMLVAGAMSLLPAGPAHAQGVLPTITVEAVERPGETGVPLGALAVFHVNRSGDLSGDFSVRLETINPSGQFGFGFFPSQLIHSVHFRPDVDQVEVRVEAKTGRKHPRFNAGAGATGVGLSGRVPWHEYRLHCCPGGHGKRHHHLHRSRSKQHRRGRGC